MSTIQFEDFLASVDLDLLGKSIHDSWWWIEPIRELRPVVLTLAGDVFLVDRSNAVYFLDTNFGILERVASSNDSFRLRLQDETFARSILRTDMILELRTRAITTKHNECYMLAVSPLVGGTVSADSARPGQFEVLLDWLGQLNQGTKDLPVGKEFRIEFPAWPGGAPNPASKGSVRKRPRDRQTFREP